MLPYSVSGEEVVIDTIAATVDDVPITLSQLSSKLTPPRRLTFEEAATDPEARAVLEQIIIGELIELEAKRRKITVSDAQIKAYFDEVARRNGMSSEDFEQALKEEKIDLDEYKKSIRKDILRSRLVSSISRNGIGVSEDEVDEYLKEHPRLLEADSIYKLRRITIAFGKKAGRDKKKAFETIQALKAKVEDGAEFAALAERFSDGREKSEGGLVGLIAPEDLSVEVSSLLADAKTGRCTAVFEEPSGYSIFHVEKRFKGNLRENDSFREEVRKIIEKRKVEAKIADYFTVELFKNHAVEKKI